MYGFKIFENDVQLYDSKNLGIRPLNTPTDALDKAKMMEISRGHSRVTVIYPCRHDPPITKEEAVAAAIEMRCLAGIISGIKQITAFTRETTRNLVLRQYRSISKDDPGNDSHVEALRVILLYFAQFE